MKEIGGYFGLEPTNAYSGEYHTDAIALNSARNALVYLAKAKNISKLYIPYFLCDSISKVCNREGIEYDYYNISNVLDFRPVFDINLEKNEYLYVVNYYGQLSNEYLKTLQIKFGNIIVDNVQAFFQDPLPNVDTIYSCRKYFGVPDGAYLYTNTTIDTDLHIDDSTSRMSHLYGRNIDGASAHYKEFKISDDSFEKLELRYMSNITHEILCKIDYKSVITKRNNNYSFLADQLGMSNVIKTNKPIGPYMYPYYHEQAQKIREELALKRIYIPMLWPNVLIQQGNGFNKTYANNIVPVPCDQRYSIEDMQIVLEEMAKCMRI